MIEHVHVRESLRGDTLVVSRGRDELPPYEERLSARITVSTADRSLATVLADAMADALRDAVPAAPPVPVVRVRTRRRAAALTSERVRGAAVIVAVSEQNLHALGTIVASVRQAGPIGVQLVWNEDAGRREIFEVLERARATPSQPPVFLARTTEPCFALRALASPQPDAEGARC